MNRFLDALRRVFMTHPHIDAAKIDAKIGDIQAGIGLAHSVVSSLPDGSTKAEALRVLDQAANVAAAAVVVAHTVEIVAGTTPRAAPSLAASDRANAPAPQA